MEIFYIIQSMSDIRMTALQNRIIFIQHTSADLKNFADYIFKYTLLKGTFFLDCGYHWNLVMEFEPTTDMSLYV